MSIHNFTLSRQLLRNLSIISLTVVLLYSASRVILSAPATDISNAAPQGKQVAVFAGGCYWGMEAVFEHLKGVSDVVSGFSGGDARTADYTLVSAGLTNHAESVKITYDPSKISYNQLLKVYFLVAHDPTELNRQGPDLGKQYRSAIFFANDEQEQAAQKYIAQLKKSRIFDKPIVTELDPLKGFYQAAAYHQNYIVHHPSDRYVVVNDLPKLAKLQAKFPDMYSK
ncbi:peptide-methionine (S)-S-oxide reductase MsrA [Nostoc sp. UCD121]|uniref:peptide-methionine (S)-S-oxide reductase MsrA n=1 Tax=unclassified Nostoc TaxID=2593658 RepID=UPI0016258CEF|nr:MULTISPECIES: peptide-methionine (S)-S-oxide reductase MsrA [unclassified Nostoc]MBC1222227.1 peptide-methionine (S)-S-oxide reductase MsrA [Nostoc sp. UCD120]MBC1278071.1 peptide-methionine (S)-S-oxide reductase MsrA [Nostoc sp. UCD121]MBC1299006.1 peptide-methionine (S)-S-oxide reductase MsrA [Nostoc sp. UCD122]